MICPKCQNLMQLVDKQGVHIEQCTECRGIFLDKGELEQIARAEQEFYAAQAAPPPYQPEGEPMPPMQQPMQPRRQAPPPMHGYADSPRPYRGGYGDSPRPYRGGGGYGHDEYGHGRRRRRGGFLENLLDFD